ncbi:peptidoglycan editing factor PgeF [Cellulomonas sp.]|uniref:peptidoglycan editing factor PgeF n=1 Tax=Cellulomonas sp. TaxID=40001 RepID=UPI001B04EDD7|nr:peptidoglycan editing factor PgeF [Cellulomonas sp.]MBO9554068.1 peptidoglycan editing factor PgeF [Cellulomonas sp.]
MELVDLGPGVRAGFTTRAGGVSREPYASLDLGVAVGDDPAAVRDNRARVERWAGAPVAYGRQVHGRAVAVVEAPPAEPPEVDALVSVSPDLAVAVVVADCVPVLLADPVAGVVAAVHAGRRGLVAGVVQATLEAMVGRGAATDRIRAAVGPAIAGASYEVPAELREEVAAVVPATWSTTSWGTPSLDLPAGVRAILEQEGVRRVSVSTRDTFTDDDLFSFRRSSVTGRFGAVVRPPER